jgi:hypothetical protein
MDEVLYVQRQRHLGHSTQNDPLIFTSIFQIKRFKQSSLSIVMGSSHSSEQSHTVVPDPEPEVEAVEEVDPEDNGEITVDDFLENSIKWLCTLS